MNTVNDNGPAAQPRTLRPDQVRAVEEVQGFLRDSPRVKLIRACGTGKTLIMHRISLDHKRTVVFLPSLSLVAQTLKEYTREDDAMGITRPVLVVASDNTIGRNDDTVHVNPSELGVPVSTDQNDVEQFIKCKDRFVIFSTYQSAEVLGNAAKGVCFDLGLFDEAHKTAGTRDRVFSYPLFDNNISMLKRLFATATERFFRDASEEIVDMHDDAVYGNNASEYTLKRAIDDGILSDYRILVVNVLLDKIKNLIEQNRVVMDGDQKTTMRTVASLIALDQAIRYYGVRHTISFHRTIARAQHFVEYTKKSEYFKSRFKDVETMHVNGNMDSTYRDRIMNEFCNVPSALISNSRCLTEGVDIPCVDGLLFADPRGSKVDIVQAMGRVLRKFPGKTVGNIIIPRILGSEEELDQDRYAMVEGIIAAIASADARLRVECRMMKKGKEPKARIINFLNIDIADDGDRRVYKRVNLENINRALELRIVNRVSPLDGWKSGEEVRDWVQKNKVSRRDYRRRSTKGELPPGFPSDPSAFYQEPWSWFSGRDRKFVTEQVAKAWVLENRISRSEYRRRATAGELPPGFPRNPYAKYQKPWRWFTENTSVLGSKFVQAKMVKQWVQENKVTRAAYRRLSGAGELPPGFPNDPSAVYQKPWSWFSGNPSSRNAEQVRPEEVRELVRKRNLSRTDYSRLRSARKLPPGFPSNPAERYKRLWSWFSGTIAPQRMKFKRAAVVRAYVRKNKVSQKRYSRLSVARKLPAGFPGDPSWTFKLPWSWFSGNKCRSRSKRQAARQKRTSFGENSAGKSFLRSRGSKHTGDGTCTWRVA